MIYMIYQFSSLTSFLLYTFKAEAPVWIKATLAKIHSTIFKKAFSRDIRFFCISQIIAVLYLFTSIGGE